jgi:hypothetical protein
MSKPLPAGRTGRSVVDYKTEEELRIALSAFAVSDDSSGTIAAKKADWILPVPDPELETQTIDGELQRLLTLRSYLMLDAESEEAFDNLTKEACELFKDYLSSHWWISEGNSCLANRAYPPGRHREVKPFARTLFSVGKIFASCPTPNSTIASERINS